MSSNNVSEKNQGHLSLIEIDNQFQLMLAQINHLGNPNYGGGDEF